MRPECEACLDAAETSLREGHWEEARNMLLNMACPIAIACCNKDDCLKRKSFLYSLSLSVKVLGPVAAERVPVPNYDATHVGDHSEDAGLRIN